jgi:hypothetical protein
MYWLLVVSSGSQKLDTDLTVAGAGGAGSKKFTNLVHESCLESAHTVGTSL